ncbi:hypothetical protein J7T55_001347 [Diaporthe amygdali]|uniref:uncharacterized protein n=1 Tax=Phomopsis amygdali TaxID=1214568 RepID=UPI0022FDFF26|nr:uncharacterized protein J7T55_001347 [Diaporthe amygdali]KAJ0106823.1 hypothetical protein J7T55_001347 [Diaporthe amygdali]
MVPESLSDVYQMYKRDTNAIATWLANTAKTNGYGAALHQENVPHAGGRLTGKARKEAKTVTKATSQHATSSANKPTHALAIREFISLATFIANADPAIQVPLFLSITLNRVIKVRATFSRILGEKSEQVDEISDASHSHFLGVLEKVRDILKPNMQVDTLDRPSVVQDTTEAAIAGSTGANDERNTTGNLFDVLNFYETKQDIPDPPDSAVPLQSDEKYEIKLEDSMSDAFLAFVALMHLGQYLRKTIRCFWQSYKLGEFPLDGIAVSTTAAIAVYREREEKLAPQIEKFGGVLFFAEVMFRAGCAVLADELSPRERCTDDIKFVAYDNEKPLMELCLMCRMLDDYRRSSSLSTIKVYDGSHGWYDEDMDMESATNRERYNQDYSALAEVLPDMSILSMASGKEVLNDEFAHGVRVMHKTNKVPLWLCFAARTYLDTLVELRGSLDLPWHELMLTSERIRSSLAKALESPGDVHLVEGWPAVKGLVKQLIQESSGWGSDPTAPCKTRRGWSIKPNQFLRRHPLYCGLWAYYMRAQFQNIGVKFASAFGYVHQSFQLYHALKQEGVLGPNQTWRDIETLMTLQGLDTFFVGDTPTTPRGYLQNLSLKSGFTTRKSASKRGKNKKTERGTLKHKGEFAMQFMNLYWKTALRGLTVCDLQQMIEETGRRFVMKEDGKILLEAPGQADPSAKPAPDNMPIHELIYGLSNIVYNENRLMAFDYFQLHRICFQYLEHIRGTIDEQTLHRLCPESAAQKHLPSVVSMIFRDAAGDEPQGLLQLAASTLLKHIKGPTSNSCTRAMRDLGIPSKNMNSANKETTMIS